MKTKSIEIGMRKSVECTGMEDMRSKFITIVEQKGIGYDKTCIKQCKADRDKGVMVAMSEGKNVAAILWWRKVNEEDGKRYYYLLCKRDANQIDFSAYQEELNAILGIEPEPKADEAPLEAPADAPADEPAPADSPEEAPQEQGAAE